jgi:hypothetical protein
MSRASDNEKKRERETRNKVHDEIQSTRIPWEQELNFAGALRLDSERLGRTATERRCYSVGPRQP